MTPRSRLNAELQSIDLRLAALDAPSPDVHGDAADMQTARQGQEDLVTERARLTETRRLIIAALIRIEEGSYSDCVECLEPIGEKRLAATPWVPRCLSCQATFERTAARGGSPLDEYQDREPLDEDHA